MKLGTYVYVAVNELRRHQLFVGKTNIQKIIYFAMPAEHRKQYYHPYYYGPYSEDIQKTVVSLLKKEGIHNLEQLGTGDEKGLSLSEDKDDILKALPVTAGFFKQNNITRTNDISFLAKVHLLSRSKREDARNNLAGYIKNQARYLGWEELAEAPIEKIQTNINLADKLEKTLAV